MRVSCIPSDPDYIGDEHGRYRAYLNEQPVERCVTASEEGGYVVVTQTDKDGNVLFDRKREQFMYEVKYGDVFILDRWNHELKVQSIKKGHCASERPALAYPPRS